MKEKLINYVGMFRSSVRMLVILWAVVLITVFTFKAFNPEIINIDPTLPKIALGLLFTLVTPLIHYFFKNRKS